MILKVTELFKVDSAFLSGQVDAWRRLNCKILLKLVNDKEMIIYEKTAVFILQKSSTLLCPWKNFREELAFAHVTS